jgi:hypothetical protein
MEKKIILTTKGNISGSDKQALRRADIIIAEVKDIDAIKIISGADYFDLDDIAISAIQALSTHNYDSVRNQFATQLLAKIIKKYTDKPFLKPINPSKP